VAGIGDTISVSEIFIHPLFTGFRNFFGRSNPHDVGIIKLSEAPADITTYAELPEAGFLNAQDDLLKGKNATPFTVVGYGATLTWPPPVLNYEETGTRRSVTSTFKALLPSWIQLSQNQRSRIDNGGTCPGDSGGPVFYGNTIVALTSWGDPLCVSTGFYYRIDTHEALDFINVFIDAN